MAPINLKPSTKGVAALAVIAGLVFVTCVLCSLGALSKVKTVDGEKRRIEMELRESQMIAQTQVSAQNKYEDTRAQIRCLESSVSTQAYVPTLLKQIEHLGQSVNLKVLGVRPKPADPNAALAKKQAAAAAAEASGGSAASEEKPEPPKPYDELGVDLELEGNYMNALDFLYKLTSFPKIVAVNSIEMIPESGEAAALNPKLSIKISATAFVFKEPSNAKPKTSDNSAQVIGGRENEAG